MYSLFSLCVMFLSVESMKFCKNCKHFIPDMNPKHNKYAKCRILPINEKNYLVTGNPDDIEYYYCTTAREHDDMCGKNASKYE